MLLAHVGRAFLPAHPKAPKTQSSQLIALSGLHLITARGHHARCIRRAPRRRRSNLQPQLMPRSHAGTSRNLRKEVRPGGKRNGITPYLRTRRPVPHLQHRICRAPRRRRSRRQIKSRHRDSRRQCPIAILRHRRRSRNRTRPRHKTLTAHISRSRNLRRIVSRRRRRRRRRPSQCRRSRWRNRRIYICRRNRRARRAAAQHRRHRLVRATPRPRPGTAHIRTRHIQKHRHRRQSRCRRHHPPQNLRSRRPSRSRVVAQRKESAAAGTRRHHIIPYRRRRRIKAAIRIPRPRQRRHSRRPVIRNHHSDRSTGQRAPRFRRAPSRRQQRQPIQNRSIRRVVANFVTLVREFSQLKPAVAGRASRHINRARPQSRPASRGIERSHVVHLIRPRLQIARRIDHPLQAAVNPEPQPRRRSRGILAPHHCIPIRRVISHRRSLPRRAVRITRIHMQILGIRRRLSHRKLPHIVRIFLNQIREVRTRPRRRYFRRRPRIRRNITVPIIRMSQRRRSRSRRLHRPSRNRRRHRPPPRHQQLSLKRQIFAERSCRRRNSTAPRIIQRRPVIRQCAVTAHRSSTCRIRRHLILARPRHRQRRPSLHSRSIRRQERIVRRSQPRRRSARPAPNPGVRRV